jgi:hypothetical protein
MLLNDYVPASTISSPKSQPFLTSEALEGANALAHLRLLSLADLSRSPALIEAPGITRRWAWYGKVGAKCARLQIEKHAGDRAERAGARWEAEFKSCIAASVS